MINLNEIKKMIIENEKLKKSEEEWKEKRDCIEDELITVGNLFKDYLIEKGQKSDFLQFVEGQAVKNKIHPDYILHAEGMLAD
ncbi:hypothetical protein RUW00_13700 [Bacillus sp. IS1]|uniref:hypothetical protein n=1 Tax=Bacillus TaxID=1386 RepID=UPI001CA40F0E|nr:MULTISPECIES: hypothetical protein [Bacillus]MDU0077229.1 hypothetical protein [Bacillus sp. IG2]MDU0102338.1 hypothetical protein [Bacillus sp. IS1]MEC2270187.1 hypothetical protein [Bacillus velezensis]MED3679363.1 hypothetical protein [Bacillus velezensis]QZY42696.1 hypothetical protein K4A81_06150 [Bacillus velezensis]